MSKDIKEEILDNNEISEIEIQKIKNLLKDIFLISSDIAEKIRVKETDTEEERKKKELMSSYVDDNLNLMMLDRLCRTFK